MTIQMHEILEFPIFYTKVKSQNLPFKISYKVALLANEIQKHIDFYQESFRDLLIKYSKKDEEGRPIPTEDGQGYLLVEETMQEAYNKLSELRELDIEVPDTKFSPDDFDGVEISPEEMFVIIPFIEV